MRLIDADVFKEAIGTDTKTRKMVCELIDKQPTAYNVEQVEKDIEWLNFKTHSVMRETGINSEVFERVRTDKYVRLDEVLAIVRNGGKE